MVYIQFPVAHTEEEEQLLKKYAKLRKKKKQLQQMKAKKPAPTTATTAAGKKTWIFPSEVPEDPKEAAKQLLKSGAISAIKAETKERHGFKRSRTLERRLTDTTDKSDAKPSSSGFIKSGNDDSDSDKSSPAPSQPKVKKLYESFVRSNNKNNEDQKELWDKDRSSGSERDSDSRIRPRKGQTVYVHGYGLTEEILKKAFNDIGKILNISLEPDKNCGFVTFNVNEEADQAINEVNGSMVQGVHLKVSLARRQPTVDNIIHVPTSDQSPLTWGTIATNLSQKGTYKDSRELRTYDQDDLF